MIEKINAFIFHFMPYPMFNPTAGDRTVLRRDVKPSFSFLCIGNRAGSKGKPLETDKPVVNFNIVSQRRYFKYATYCKRLS
jgi:hypothetical protein